MIEYVIISGILLFLFSTAITYGIIWAIKHDLTFLELLKKYFYVPIATFVGSLLMSLLIYILLRLLIKPKVNVETEQEYDPVLVQHERNQLSDDVELLRLFTNPNPENERQASLDRAEALLNIKKIYDIISWMNKLLRNSKNSRNVSDILIILTNKINKELPYPRKPITVNLLSSLGKTKDFIRWNQNKLILRSIHY